MKRTDVFLSDGLAHSHLWTYSGRLDQVQIGEDFYVGQTRYIVVDVADNFDDPDNLVVTVGAPKPTP